MKTTFLLICFFIYTPFMFSQNSDEVNAKLSEIYKLDQIYRKMYDEETDQEKKEELSQLMFETDKKNQEYVLPLLDKLTSDKNIVLDDISWRTCFLVLQHADFEIQYKYKDFIFDYFKQGKIMNYEYLLFMDRLCSQTNKLQIFGSQSAELPNDMFLVFPYSSYEKRKKAFAAIDLDINSFSVLNGKMKFSSKKSEKEEISKQYPILELNENEFAFVGIIVDENNKGIENVEVFIEGNKQAVTNNTGYFSIVINKKNVPKSLKFVYQEKSLEHSIKEKTREESDYSIIAKSLKDFN